MSLFSINGLVPFVPFSLATLGSEMRAAADKYTTEAQKNYSNNETEMLEKLDKKDEDGISPRHVGEWMWKVGLSRAVLYEGNTIITLCISRETLDGYEMYRLSMCRVAPGRGMFAAVPDDDAMTLAKHVLGEDCERVPNPSGIENAKHFVRRLDT